MCAHLLIYNPGVPVPSFMLIVGSLTNHKSPSIHARLSTVMGPSPCEEEYLLVVLLEHVGEMALATILAIEVLCHEDAGTTLFLGALATHASDLGTVDLIVLQHMKLDLLLCV